jgi:peptide/nickel transport system substrate-binding protein
VLPRHLLAEFANKDFISADFHKHPVGSGPFLFEEWESGSHIVLKANRDYYNEGPYLDRIIIKFILDGNSLMFQLESGGIMGADNVPNAFLGIASGIEKIKIYKTPALFLEHLDLNCSRFPLDDNRVRRALSLAINREEISEKIYNGIWVPAYSDEHPDSPFHTGFGKKFNGYNPGLAKTLLEEGGWRDTDGDGIREKGGRRLKLEISTVTGRANRKRTEVVLAKQLDDIGVELKIKNYHPSVLFGGFDDGGILSGGKYDIALYAFMAPPDPSTKETSYSAEFLPPVGQNYSYFRNDTLTHLLSLGSSTVSFDRRKKLYSEILERLAREVPVIPLLWITQVDAMPTALRNYRPNPTQSGDTWNANMWWLER